MKKVCIYLKYFKKIIIYCETFNKISLCIEQQC